MTALLLVPPQAPSYSCALAEGSGSTTRVTLTWTEPPSDDSIDQYCITSSPEYSSACSVCVTPDVQTHQYEVQQGLEYNFTILAVNCGNQNGTETAPISVFPQGMYVCMYVCMYACLYTYICTRHLVLFEWHHQFGYYDLSHVSFHYLLIILRREKHALFASTDCASLVLWLLFYHRVDTGSSYM